MIFIITRSNANMKELYKKHNIREESIRIKLGEANMLYCMRSACRDIIMNMLPPSVQNMQVNTRKLAASVA